jgi:hypothetical protein
LQIKMLEGMANEPALPCPSCFFGRSTDERRSPRSAAVFQTSEINQPSRCCTVQRKRPPTPPVMIGGTNNFHLE